MLKAAAPVVWFVNLFVLGLLKLMRIQATRESGPTLSQEELRSLVIEGQYFRGKHRTMLANLLDLEAITIDDVMTPRNQIHAININDKGGHLVQQLSTAYHTRLPVYEDELDNIIGTLHLKQVLHLQHADEIDGDSIRSVLRPAYYIPSGTSLLAQLQQFQNDRERLGLVVDEYGELQGLATIEDIIEEIIGDFTTDAPGAASTVVREADGSVIADGMTQLRTLNRKLGTTFPLDGPRTLNGLIVEQLGEIPDAGTTLEIAGQFLEILQTQDRAIKVVRLRAPAGPAPEAPLQSAGGQASSTE
jgi:Mg2+/Co2+ transporter CorB